MGRAHLHIWEFPRHILARRCLPVSVAMAGQLAPGSAQPGLGAASAARPPAGSSLLPGGCIGHLHESNTVSTLTPAHVIQAIHSDTEYRVHCRYMFPCLS